MLLRTLIGIVLGLCLAATLILNMNLVLSLPVDVELSAGLLLGFMIWCAAMTYIYAAESLKRALLLSGSVLTCSALFNAYLIIS